MNAKDLPVTDTMIHTCDSEDHPIYCGSLVYFFERQIEGFRFFNFRERELSVPGGFRATWESRPDVSYAVMTASFDEQPRINGEPVCMVLTDRGSKQEFILVFQQG